MTTRAEMAHDLKLSDARTLEEAARVLRRRRVKPVDMSLAALCRLLAAQAASLRAEAAAEDATPSGPNSPPSNRGRA